MPLHAGPFIFTPFSSRGQACPTKTSLKQLSSWTTLWTTNPKGEGLNMLTCTDYVSHKGKVKLPNAVSSFSRLACPARVMPHSTYPTL